MKPKKHSCTVTPCFPFVYCVTQTIKLTYYHHNFFRESLRFEIPQLQYFLDSSVLRIVLDKRMVTKPCLFSWIIFWGLHFQSTSQKRNFLVRTVYDWFSVFHHCDETKKKIQSAAFSKKKHTHSNTQSYQIHIHTIFFLQKKTYFK